MTTIVLALADALRLDVAERQHLDRLARITDGAACTGHHPPPREDVRPTVRALLTQLEPGIAMITNRLGDILARTSGLDLLAGSSGLLEGARPNLTRWVFTDPRARRVLPDWDRVADERAFDLWLGPTAQRSAAFREEIAPLAGEELRRRVDRTAPPPRAVLRWRHPVGELRFDREVLELPVDDAQQLVAFLPADDATANALEELRCAGVTLRSVP